MAIEINITKSASLPGNELSSLWDGLSPHLIARIFEVNNKGDMTPDGPVVRAPFGDDVQLDADFNWQSPFENAGAEGTAPSLSSLLQSGAAKEIAESLGMPDGISGLVKEAQGRTGMTKLNSTQVFNGAPPVRIQGELLLRAWKDPSTEVENPLDQLMQWALPKLLAPEGTMVTAVAAFAREQEKNARSFVDSFLPSRTPSLLAIIYKGRRYAPMVIERIGVPLGSPVDKTGRFTQLRLPITFASLQAWDRYDWQSTRMEYGLW